MKIWAYGILLSAATAIATPASAVVSVEVPDVGSYQLIGSGNAAVTYGGVTFSQSGALSNGNFFNVSTGFSSQPAVLSSQQQTIGVPNILITLPEFATSVGISYGMFFNGSVNFLLSNGQSFTQSVSSSTYNTPYTFLSGLTDPFNSILVTSGSVGDVLSVRGVTYDIGTTAVPEPGTWAMLIIGFSAVGLAMRRRAKQKVRVRFAL